MNSKRPVNTYQLSALGIIKAISTRNNAMKLNISFSDKSILIRHIFIRTNTSTFI